MTHIVQTASANMPSSCWGKYGRIAVLEIDETQLPQGKARPSMISTHARGVVRVVRTWERLNIGITDRCAFERALKEAKALRDKLNA